MDGTDHAPGPLGTILSIWAHPDDETYLAAGIMATARDEGRRVVCASATAGERGTDDPDTWPPERLGPVRRSEAAAAMAVLGVDEHRVLGLPDGALAEHHEQGLATMELLVDEVDPDTVVTFGPDGETFHPDHIAVHRWVTAAWQRRDHSFRLLYATATTEHLGHFGDLYERWGVYMTDQRPSGVPPESLAVHLHLEGAELDRKLAALRAMPSQTSEVMDRTDPATYAALAAEEAFVDAAGSQGFENRRRKVQASRVASMSKVVAPTMPAIDSLNSLPGQEWPPPSTM
jgi:LmbE family N-acetylglucosaminyl deacetylase